MRDPAQNQLSPFTALDTMEETSKLVYGNYRDQARDFGNFSVTVSLESRYSCAQAACMYVNVYYLFIYLYIYIFIHTSIVYCHEAKRPPQELCSVEVTELSVDLSRIRHCDLGHLWWGVLQSLRVAGLRWIRWQQLWAARIIQNRENIPFIAKTWLFADDCGCVWRICLRLHLKMAPRKDMMVHLGSWGNHTKSARDRIGHTPVSCRDL